MNVWLVVAAALSLAGAPANTNVICGAPVPQLEDGWTWWDQTPNLILLGDSPCQAVVFASVSPTARVELRTLNPTVNFDVVTGVGLLVLQHEAAHAAGLTDETDAECTAMRLLPTLLAQFGLPADDFRYAAYRDAMLPPQYHEHPCLTVLLEPRTLRLHR